MRILGRKSSYIMISDQGLNKFSSNEEDAPEAYVKNVTHRKGCGKRFLFVMVVQFHSLNNLRRMTKLIRLYL
ncbi:hypothetical protein ACET3Z_032010 [Daucus carota]